MGEKPHRKANNIGKEFVLIPDPLQGNELAVAIAAVGSAWFTEIAEAPAAVPAIRQYTYLTREQEWRGRATGVHTQMQCGVPVKTAPLTPLITPRENAIPPDPNEDATAPPAPRKFARSGTPIRFSQYAKRKEWESGLYGTPVSMGVATEMIRHRRGALYAPVIFTMLSLSATWGDGWPESLSGLIHQLHENAKLLRYGIAHTLLTILQGWGEIRIVLFAAASIVMFWKLNRWIPVVWKKEDAPRLETTSGRPVPADLPPPGVINANPSTEGATPPTGTGMDVAEATRPSTGVGGPGLETLDDNCDADDDDSPRRR